MRVFELKISEDDDISGIQYLSIVKSPANEVMFEVFSDEKPHTCYVEHDFSDEAVKVIEKFGVELNPEMLKYARIKPAEIILTKEDFAAPPINTNPRAFDIKSGDQEGGNVITRYIYGIDTGMGAPLIRTSREMCRKMIAAQRVFSRQDIINLSTSLTSASDTFKLVPRAKMNASVDAFEFKMGALCRHRWFQIEFDVPQDMTYDQALAMIPLRASAALGKGRNVGGAGRPFEAEAKIVPASQLNRRPAGFAKEEDFSPVGFHYGLFMYPSRKAAFLAEPTAKKITKIKIEMCGEGWGCGGWIPIEVFPEYFEGTAKVVDSFAVRHSFVEVPKYIQEAAQRAVDFAEENGWGDCGTDVGKQRAHDLARSGAEHSLETLTRMFSYGSRHKVDWEASKSVDDGCGYLMMLSWGFSPDNYDSAMSWLEGQIEKATEMNIQFSKDDYRQDITAVVFQPNQYIYRYDRETNQPYYVFMSKDTIRTALMKLSRLKPKNLINFEHSDKVFAGNDVYSYENWLVGEDPMKDKSYEIFGREFAPGTWITTIHFRNEQLFEDFILSNKTAGISLEGLFEEIPFSFIKEQDFVYPNAGESEGDFIGRCMGSSKMVSEFPNEDQRLAVCYSYYQEKMSEDDILEDKEMVDGVIELLLKVEDLDNRKEMLKDVIRDFAEEGVAYDYDDFITRVGVVDFGFNFPEGTCWEGYEPYGTKIKDGREVPNCVPMRTNKQDMGLQGINGKVPYFDYQEEAEKMAEKIECEGSHKMEYGFVPCRTHAEAEAAWDAYTRVFLLEELIKKVMS
jgi:hypothetical protein